MQNSIPFDYREDKRGLIPQVNHAGFYEHYAALIEEHGNLATVFGVAEQDMYDCYQEALQAYHDGDYLLASHYFSLLTFLNPQDGQLYLATGNAQQQLGEHARALQYFSAAAERLPVDPGVWFRLAECQVALSQYEEGRESLRQCLSLYATDNARPGLYSHAKALMDQLL
jgi:tetratricopeptide (TPR) repeat protein